MEKLTKIEKIILAAGVGVGLGAAFLGAGMNITGLMYSGASMAGATVLSVCGYKDYRDIKEEDKIKKPSCNRISNEQTGKGNYCWNPRDWR